LGGFAFADVKQVYFSFCGLWGAAGVCCVIGGGVGGMELAVEDGCCASSEWSIAVVSLVLALVCKKQEQVVVSPNIWRESLRSSSRDFSGQWLARELSGQSLVQQS